MSRPGRNDRDLVDQPDSEDDKALVPAGKGIGKALAATVANGVWAGLLVMAGSLGLPFMGPAWATVLPALLAERAVAAGKEFMMAGWRDNSTIQTARLLRSGAGVFANAMLWQHYPFLFSQIGLPPEVDRYLPLAFLGLAAIHGIGGLVALVKLLTGGRKAKKAKDRGDAVS